MTGKFSPWKAQDLERVRGLVEEVLALVDAGGRADAGLKGALRRSPQLSGAERAALAELSLGVTAARRRLEAHCAHSGDTLVEAYLAFKAGDLEPPEALGVRWSVPDSFAAALCDELGRDAAEAFLSAVAEPGPVCLRVDARSDRAAVAAELPVPSRETPRSPWGLVLQDRANIRGLEAWRAGVVEVQDEGSQAIVAFCELGPRERVLDRCAGRGGKSLALAALLEEGELVCTDVDGARLADLRVRFGRRGPHPGTLTVGGLGAASGEFDLVLVDAPCSESGTLRRSPDLRTRLSEASVLEAARLQREILEDAAGFVAPGGRLVYATCAVLRAENEDQVAAFLARHPTFALEAEQRLWPHLDDTDGFYMARLRLTSA